MGDSDTREEESMTVYKSSEFAVTYKKSDQAVTRLGREGTIKAEKVGREWRICDPRYNERPADAETSTGQ